MMIGLTGSLAYGRAKRVNVPTLCAGTIKPLDTSFTWQSGIQGEATVTVRSSQEDFTGVWVELITLISSKVKTALTECHIKESEPNVVLLGIRFGLGDVNGSSYVPAPRYKLQQGTYKYTFDLPMKGWTLPSSFKNNSCQVEHFVVLIARSDQSGLQILDKKCVSTAGRLSLRGSSILGQPLMVKGILENWSEEDDDDDDIEVTMRLPKRAYLPTECIEGTLVIENGVDLKELLVELERRVENYDDQGNYKQTDNIVGKTSRAGTNDLSVWEFRLNPELSLMPTWESREDGFNVSYCLRFIVTTKEGKEIKGEADIVIGTHYSSSGGGGGNLLSCATSIVAVNCDGSSSVTTGGNNTNEHQHHFLGRSLESLPPAYSALSSRCASMTTLPPSYDTAMTSATEKALLEMKL